MRRKKVLTALLSIMVTALAAGIEPQAWDTRREVREGSYEVNHERREARREIRNADSPMEARHEVREGAREINGERREASRQIRRSTW